MGQLKCTIQAANFVNSPYNLAWGSSIYANVIAVNKAGNSVTSSNGNGAQILTTPAAPVNLANNAG